MILKKANNSGFATSKTTKQTKFLNPIV